MEVPVRSPDRNVETDYYVYPYENTRGSNNSKLALNGTSAMGVHNTATNGFIGISKQPKNYLHPA